MAGERTLAVSSFETAGCNMSVKRPERPRSRAMIRSFVEGQLNGALGEQYRTEANPAVTCVPKSSP